MNGAVRRLLTLLFAAAQFALPAAASIADGLAARATGNPRAHVENVAGTHCQPVHGADCTLCRYLSGTSATPAATPLTPIQSAVGQCISSENIAGRSAAHFQAHSRAPPTLLV